MVNPFLLGSPQRVKQLEEQERERLRWGNAEHLRFSDWPAIAFDLDHTLAIYRLPQLHKLCYERVVAQLSQGEYADITFRPFGEMDRKFAQRGIFYDKQRGVVLKLDGNGDIEQAYHGTTRMEKEEIDDIYAGCTQLITLKYGPFIKAEEDSVIKPVIYCFNDHFMIATIYLLMELVQLYIEGKKIHYGFERPFRDLIKAYNTIFKQEDFLLGRAGFFSALREDPAKYLCRLSYSFIRLLKKLRSNKIATIVVTNSAPDFANFVLQYIIGPHWRTYFDAVIYDSKKPYFFSLTSRPFFWVDTETARQGARANPEDFKAPVYVSQGSVSGIKYILRAANGHFTNRILYVGDSLVTDICACAIAKSCGIIAVVTELQEEYETAWGPMMGTPEKPSFWYRKLEEWAIAWAVSVEELASFSPTKDIKMSTPKFRLVKDGRAQGGPS